MSQSSQPSFLIPTLFRRNTVGTIVFPLSIVQWNAINACDMPDITFENTHIEELANEYKCPICMELLTYPMSVGTCGHLYCKDCIFTTIRARMNTNTTQQCPSCRDPFTPQDIRVDNHAKRIIGNIHVKCPNHQITDRNNALLSQRRQLRRNLQRASRERSNRNRNGNNGGSRSRSRSRSRDRNANQNEDNDREALPVCSWHGEYRNLKQHLETCELTIISCGTCGIPILRHEAGSHNRSCPWKAVQCLLCNGRYLQCERARHENVCPMKVIPCGYCGTQFERRRMKNHWDILCANFPLECQFKEHGCNEIVTRANMETHLTDKQLDHLQMMAQGLTQANELKEQYEELTANYDELQGSYDNLQEDYNGLEERCNDLEERCDSFEGENEELKTSHDALKETVHLISKFIARNLIQQ